MVMDFPPQGALLTFTRQQRDALLHDTMAVPSHIHNKIAAAPWDGERVRVWLELDDLEELVNAVAWEAKHAAYPERAKLLVDLYHRLAAVLDKAIGIDRPESDAFAIREMFRAFMNLMEDFDGDPESAQEELARRMKELNRRTLPELGGLSPEQTSLLNSCGWWDEPFPIRLAPNLPFDQVGQTRFLHHVRVFLQAVEDFDGAPTTAQGNLKRAFVAHLLDRMDLDPDYLEMMRRACKVINESDIWPLHIARVVCQVGKLVRKYKKRFVLTRKGRELLPEEHAGGLYHHLFHTMFREFNLDYISHHADVPAIQATLPYALYRISQLPLGQDHDIEDLVPIVFVPAVQLEISQVWSHEEAQEWLLEDHVLRPLESLGLVQIGRGEAKPGRFSFTHRVRRLPLFDEFIRFEV